MGLHRNSPKASPVKKSVSSPVKKPVASPVKTSVTLQYLFNLETNTTNGSSISSPKSGKQSSFESENEQIQSLISHCGLIFTFTDPQESPSQQDFKRLKLLHLLTLLKSTRKPLPDGVISSLVSMIAVNLFRPLPPSSNQNISSELADEEDLGSILSPAWPHLQIAYDILQKLVQVVDPKILRNYVDPHFLASLLALFQSDDPRERECVKNVYHRIYARFTFYRSFMRKSTNDVFLHYICEAEKHSGIAELLEIWGSIINGFTVPLKEEHKLFLMRVLIPLHKCKRMQVYSRQLSYCVSQFVQKEPMLGGVIVRGILRYWPVTNCQKEVLLIGELEELVENMDPDQYRKLGPPICSQITRCLNSWNVQVAERALYIWNNEQFVKMASWASEEVFPVVIEGMEKNLKWHWSKSVKQLTENVKAMLKGMDPILYDKCLAQVAHRENLACQEEIKRKERWERVEMEAAKNQFLPPTQCICVSN
ncbi:hypothetical protein Tsubulata_017156 [Turnera subulata]|uniref:Serine/threonine protein phosphatase 2A regulatory subunit n=1 Tax=Turnera subulata TaxID=218843 RepID=A0A9Q0FDM8_9ROSI|nr:hypothetical protein Tsubulata_017156 [Turnera subulata]